MDNTYNQPIKNIARQKLISGAIKALTTNRRKSTLVRVDELTHTIAYATGFLEQAKIDRPTHDEMRKILDWFKGLYSDMVGMKRASQLKVLYLAGPEPQNDLQELIKLGCRPENIWAIENDRNTYKQAIKALRHNGHHIRLHHGSLASFFERVREKFDIVYIDGCGPCFGGKPSTIRSVLELFLREGLSDISALLTNFSSIPDSRTSEYLDVVANYFSPRYNETPKPLWEAGYDPAIGEGDLKYCREAYRPHLRDAYSDFITRIISDCGRRLVPLAKVGANPDVLRKFLKDPGKAVKDVEQACRLPAPGEDVMAFMIDSKNVRSAPGAYPLLSFMIRGMESEGRSLLDSLASYSVDGRPLVKSYGTFALIENVFEGHFELASKELIEVFRENWFDYHGGYFCDVPMPSLAVNLLAGCYGHPYLTNAAKSFRFSYTAKKTEMFCDMFLLDRARYLFDCMPTIDLVPSKFKSHAFQLLIRACIDRIGWHDFSSSSKLFSGTALGGISEYKQAKPINFRRRQALN